MAKITQEEKAKELIKKFTERIPYIFNNLSISDVERYEMAKQCSYVLTEELINWLPSIDTQTGVELSEDYWEWWTKVETELKN